MFILELGKGFAFVERQKRMIIDGDDFYLDLLFYHLKLRSFVVIELKARPFQPEFTGKLNLMRSDSIIILCLTKNASFLLLCF